MQEFLSLLSLSNIIALPWYVSVPGLLVVALFSELSALFGG